MHRPYTESTHSINKQWMTKVRTKAIMSVGMEMNNHNNRHSGYTITGWVVRSDSGSCWVTWVAAVELLLVVGISIWGSHLTGFQAFSDLLKSLLLFCQEFHLFKPFHLSLFRTQDSFPTNTHSWHDITQISQTMELIVLNCYEENLLDKTTLVDILKPWYTFRACQGGPQLKAP